MFGSKTFSKEEIRKEINFPTIQSEKDDDVVHTPTTTPLFIPTYPQNVSRYFIRIHRTVTN